MKFGKRMLREWAEGKDELDDAGMAGHGNYCPIATCIKEVMGADYAYAGFEYIVYHKGGRERHIETPKWAIEFIANIDDLSGHTVMAHDVLTALKGV